MTPLQMLADSIRPLAEVLVDRLRAADRASPLDRLHRRWDDDEHDAADRSQPSLPFPQENGDAGRYETQLRPLRPDEAAAAVLLGRALDQNREALRRLRDRTTIAIIQVPGPELVDLVERILQDVVLGEDTTVIDGDRCTAGDEVAPPGSVIVFSRDAESDKKTSRHGNVAFGAAMQRWAAVIGIAADPDRALPSDLIKLADSRITLPPLDADTIAAVIEAITGRKPPTVAEELACTATLGALVAGVRADLGAEGSLQRLKRLVGGNRDASSEPALADLHGLGAAGAWGEALVADLRDYKAGRLPWSAVDRGALITGAPGTGKTTFARALAKAAGAHFIATSYSDWQSNGEGHLGNVTKAIRNVFAEARRHSPSILFIDEIDSLPARGAGDRHDTWFRACVNCLLAEFTDDREGLVILAASNFHPGSARNPTLDPALVRAGRLDRHIEIPLPDVPALIGIIRMHLGHDLAGVDLRPAALAARGRTGADVERFAREARRAARKQARELELRDLLDAIGGDQRLWAPDARQRVAYHEAGHTIATLSLGLAKPVAISIDGAGGLTENEITAAQALTRGHYKDLLVALMAGRAAEILAFGEPTAGAGGADGSDLDRATQLALRLETSYGLGQFGPVSVGGSLTTRDLLLMPELRSAVRQALEAAEAQALELLTANRQAVVALADALFQSGYLDRPEIDNVLAAAPLHRKQAQAALVPSVAGEQANYPGNADEIPDWPDEAPPPNRSSPP